MMSHLKNTEHVFVVSTRLQLMNAIEAIHKFGASEYHLIIIRKQRNVVYDDLKQFLEPERISIFNISGPGGLKRYFLILSLLRFYSRISKLKYIDHLYLGNYYEVFQNVLARKLARVKSLTFIEDGIHTLQLPARIQTKYFRKEWTLKKRLVYFLKFGFVPFELNREPTFFTTYNIQFPFGLKVDNDYAFFRGLVATKPVEDHIYILGTVWSGQDLTKVYHHTIKMIREENPGKLIYFFPHPTEDIEVIKPILKSQEINIILNDKGIELYLIRNAESLPSAIYAYYSSSLVVLKDLVPDIALYNIPMLKVVSNVADYFKANEIGVHLEKFLEE